LSAEVNDWSKVDEAADEIEMSSSVLLASRSSSNENSVNILSSSELNERFSSVASRRSVVGLPPAGGVTIGAAEEVDAGAFIGAALEADVDVGFEGVVGCGRGMGWRPGYGFAEPKAEDWGGRAV
jgi:hypothetical protein